MSRGFHQETLGTGQDPGVENAAQKCQAMEGYMEGKV